jgi:hypothetical protein
LAILGTLKTVTPGELGRKDNPMSADNGVFIVKFPDGYRWAYAQAIENIDYYPEGSLKRKKELKRYFGKSRVYNDYLDAYIDAEKWAEKFIEDDDFGILEYGICYYGEYESFE